MPGNVLDYGCGDGQVAELIAKHTSCTVALADVYEHGHIKETGLKFRLFPQGSAVPFGAEEFDSTLAITVFHHSSNPLNSMKDVCRVTKPGGRVIVIESVFGVDKKDLPADLQKKNGHYTAFVF